LFYFLLISAFICGLVLWRQPRGAGRALTAGAGVLFLAGAHVAAAARLSAWPWASALDGKWLNAPPRGMISFPFSLEWACMARSGLAGLAEPVID